MVYESRVVGYLVVCDHLSDDTVETTRGVRVGFRVGLVEDSMASSYDVQKINAGVDLPVVCAASICSSPSSGFRTAFHALKPSFTLN